MLLFTPSGFDYNQYMVENLNADTINQNWFSFFNPHKEKQRGNSFRFWEDLYHMLLNR